MKKTLLVLTSLVLMLLAGSAFGQEDVQLIAGQHTVVGNVTVDRMDGYIRVRFNTSGGWTLLETHVEIALNADQIDGKNGNPSPGQFRYSDGHDPMTSFYYDIPLKGNLPGEKKNKPGAPYDWTAGGQAIIVAAHAVVAFVNCDTDLLALALPAQVSIQIERFYPGAPAYIPAVYVSPIGDPTILDGTYPGWCVDADRSLRAGPQPADPPGPYNTYICDVFSSYDIAGITASLGGETPAVMENLANLPAVNWILNNVYVGQAPTEINPASTCGGLITYGDIQYAIWNLLDDALPPNLTSLGLYTMCRAGEIYDAALANNDFEPECDDYVGIILAPYRTDSPDFLRQPIIIPLAFPYGEETAWGAGPGFSGSNWAMYIPYTVEDPAP